MALRRNALVYDLYRFERFRGYKQCLPDEREQPRWWMEDGISMGHLFGFKKMDKGELEIRGVARKIVGRDVFVPAM